mmetsp:Transcript_57769/g.159392  ORF Transcript_57769/g.159392 Transcript_57769/m.159392 type:complete len:443 (+) Transcript_57769:147-1475(+)
MALSAFHTQLHNIPNISATAGQNFVDSATNEVTVMAGPNIVVKGYPYLPEVSGTTYCDDDVTMNDECRATNSCEACTTFNQADIDHIKEMGWDTIRLGVAWAGAQPRDEDALDPEFLQRLHAILDLCDDNGINVLLDNHGDMVGSAGCGNGVPMWFQQKASPDLIGKQLTTGFPYSLISSLQVTNVGGYDHCGDDAEKWAAYAGDPNYNLLNECCQAMNGPNPAGLGYTKISQATMNYMIDEGQGRDDFVRFWRLMAEAVVDHPRAFAFELMNEPMTIWRRDAFKTWRACAEAIVAVIPDSSVALADTGEGSVTPTWLTSISSFLGGGITIDRDTLAWIKASSNVFYAWHWYGQPDSTDAAVKNAAAIMDGWDVPSFATEFMSCNAWNSAQGAGISTSYWHYSSYCNIGSDSGAYFGNHTVDDSFGACILGWAGGNSHYECN